jgi:hypothetical protein
MRQDQLARFGPGIRDICLSFGLCHSFLRRQKHAAGFGLKALGLAESPESRAYRVSLRYLMR